MGKRKGLRRRWLTNTLGAVCILGFVCVMLITVCFAWYSYASLEADLRYRADVALAFFGENQNQSEAEFLDACVAYVHSFTDREQMELQFIDAQGALIASSSDSAGAAPNTPEMGEAIAQGTPQAYVGKDPATGLRILAVSGPVTDAQANVVGLLRYVSATQNLDKQILVIGLMALAILLVISAVVLISSNYYIHSILVPLNQIVDKAKMIAGGSYGIQIQTKYDDEVGELAQTINEMSMQINQNEKTQTEFISSLSHELRTPLTAITGWSETLLSSEGLDDGTRRGVGIILREGKRLTEMVLELLDFTRIQDGRMTLNMEMADVRADFEDTVFMYGSRLAQEGIRLEYLDSDEDLPEVSCDPKRLRQVYLNILDNAAKHGGEGKRIEASIGCEEGSIVVRIRDFGPGIPEDELSLVKKKFYKGSSKVRGSDIGLAVCDEIVQMHGGELILENASGGGTLVTVRLPVGE